MKRFRRNKKGFTLVEILVVIAIIGILASIVTVSALTIMRNNEKKSAKTALNNYWKMTTQVFNQINLGYTTVNRPTVSVLATRFGVSPNKIALSTGACSSLSKGSVHIQYAENPTNLKQRFTITCITLNYNGNYYYTEDGRNYQGPKDSLT